MDTTNQPKPRRIAVIGIHGVGEHLPGATARGIARQLQHTQQGRYGAFAETERSIPVDAEDVKSEIEIPPGGKGWLRNLLRGFGSNFKTKVERGQVADIDIAFSRSLLAHCSGGETYKAIYDTFVLEGTDVDIHELYWSDLSHFGSGAFAIFDQIIQLMIHVSSLGRTVAATILGALGKVPEGERTCWRLFYGLNATSYWLLSIPIVVGNLILVLLAALLIPALLGDKPVSIAIVGLAAIFVAVGTGLLLFRRGAGKQHNPKAPWATILVSLIGGIATAGAAQLWLYGHTDGVWHQMILILLELPLLGGVGEVMMRSYDKSRPGALAAWHAMIVLLGLWMAAVFVRLYYLPAAADLPFSLSVWLGHTVEAPFAFLVLVWGGLYLTNAALWLAGTGLKRTESARQSEEITRSVNTSFIAASLPAPLFLALVLGLWGFAFALFGKSIKEVPPFTPWCGFLFGGTGGATDFIRNLIDKSANPLFLVYIILMAFAVLLLVSGTLPSIFAEVFPPGRPAKSATKDPSRSLGNWLDGGFTLFGGAAILAAFGFFAVMPAGSVLVYWHPAWAQAFLEKYPHFVAYSGAIFGATSLSFLAATKLFASTLSTSFGKVRVPVDTALDVDNWLRERPVGATVRLKIFARFAALLADVKGSGYAGIVIVAHSQGTVIAADFFRYMSNDRPAFLADLPARHILTLGSPLRQLYALRFPILYWWVRRPARNDATGGPSPSACGFEGWTNAYGSGDYVGRYLWRAADDVDRWDRNTKHANSTAEFCIGPSAHTHYFDEDNAAIGDCIDGLIQNGLRAAIIPPPGPC
jgi:hypothetical protein